MEEIKKKIEWALSIINPLNNEANFEEKTKAFEIIKSTISLIYE